LNRWIRIIEKQIRSLKNRKGSIVGKYDLIVYLATHIMREAVNIDISKKGFPNWQVASILDQKEAALMNRLI